MEESFEFTYADLALLDVVFAARNFTEKPDLVITKGFRAGTGGLKARGRGSSSPRDSAGTQRSPRRMSP